MTNKPTPKPQHSRRRAHVAPRARRAAPGKPKSGKKATSGKGRPKSQNSAKGSKSGAGAREDSKAANVLALLRRPDGANLKELRKATGWQAHSVRGFLSGTVAKRMGFAHVGCFRVANWTLPNARAFRAYTPSASLRLTNFKSP